MGSSCDNCCRSCCYSTPFVTLSVVAFTGLSLLGFILSGIYGVAKMDELPHIKDGTVVMAPVVCGSFVLTLLPLVLITIMSYCITGYIRDVLFQTTIKSCIGSISLNLMLLVCLLMYVLLWIVMVIGLSGVMVFSVQLELACSQREMEALAGSLNSTCLPYVSQDFSYLAICNENDLSKLCTDGLPVGRSFSAALFFSVMVTMGIVMLTAVHVGNFVSGRDHIDYRDNTRNEYDMKRR